MKVTQRFMKGMTRDLNPLDLDNSSYYFMENADIISQDGESFDSVSNLKGNSELDVIWATDVDTSVYPYTEDPKDPYEDWKIVGSVNVRDDIVLFYANEDTSNKSSRIDLLKYNGDNYIRINLVVLDLNFQYNKIVHSVSNYESSSVIKVYFAEKSTKTEDISHLRYINIAPDFSSGVVSNDKLQASYSTVNSFIVSDLETIGIFNTDAPEFVAYGSGNLRNGIVQYSYRLLNKDGQKSAWSLLSDTIAVYDGDKNQSVGINLGDITTNKSVILSIENTNPGSSYDSMEVVRLWYSSINSIPKATIISRRSIITSNLEIVDTTYDYGLGEVSYEEFNEQYSFYEVKSMITKDNRLFLGNTSSKSFDIEFDARAYRFDSGNECKLYNDAGVLEYTLDSTSSTWKDDARAIPIDADVINQSNDISKDGTVNEYNLDENGVLGATGPNLYIRFNSLRHNDGLKYGRVKGYMLDEIYRFGIVFIDKYGRHSSVKFICDLRMPHADYGLKSYVPSVRITNYGEAAGYDYMIVRALREEKDRTVMAQGLATSIHTNSTSNKSHYNSLYNVYYGDAITKTTSARLTGSDNHIRFHSPEGLFFNKANYSGMYMEAVRITKLNPALTYYGKYTDANGDTNLFNSDDLYPDSFAVNDRFEITEAELMLSLETVYIGGDTISNEDSEDVTMAIGDCEFKSDNSKCTMLYFNTPVTLSGALDEFHVVNIRQYILPYGGGSYSKRLNTLYVPASKRSTSVYTKCVYGDTFTNDFSYANSLWHYSEYSDPLLHIKCASTVKLLSIQSSVNLNLRHDKVFTEFSDDIGLIQNTEKGLSLTETYDYFTFMNGNKFESRQVDYSPMNLYNSVYSVDNKVKLAIEIPDYLIKDEHTDTAIRYSDKKVSGEFYDSWLSFRPNNFKELDANYGSLNYMTRLNEQVYAFQDTSVVNVSINPTVQTTGDDGTAVILGTGGVLHNFRYVSDKIGIQNCNESVSSVSFIYWIDLNKKKLYRLSGQGPIQSISDLKGMSSYFSKTLNKDTKFIGVYDNSRNSVLLSISNGIDGVSYEDTSFTVINHLGSMTLAGDFTNTVMEVGLIYKLYNGSYYSYYRLLYKHSTYAVFEKLSGHQFGIGNKVYMHNYMDVRDSYTIVFNEPLNTFIGFESFIPDLYVKIPKGFMSSSNSNMLYQHNIGEYGRYYGVTYPMVFEYVLKSGTSNAYYESVELINEATILEDKVTDKTSYEGLENITIDSIRGVTNTQQSEYVDLFVKDSTPTTEVIGDEVTDNLGSNNYVSSNRSILDSNGIAIVPYPNYLFNIVKDLNQFKMAIPRNKTGILDSYGNPINELLNGNYCKVRLLYNNTLSDVKFKILNINTYLESYEI